MTEYTANQHTSLSPYIPALTGLRALAALMVFLHHYLTRLDHGIWWVKLGLESYTGVVLFFVLSGFLIQYRYYDWFTHGMNSYGRYFKARVARVWPLYVVLSTVTIVAQYLYHGSEMGTPWQVLGLYLLNVTFIKGFAMKKLLFTGLAQGWSLTVEYSYYVMAPWLMLHARTVWRKVKFALGLMAVGVTIYAGYALWAHIDVGYVLHHIGIYTIFGRIFEFLVGMQLALWYKQRSAPVAEVSGVTFYKSFTHISLVAMLIFFVFGAFVVGGSQVAIETVPGLFLHNLVLPILVAMLIWGLLHERTWLSRLLSSQEFQVLGRSSYAFYLIHIGVFQYFLEAVLGLDVLACFVILWVAAWLLYEYVEAPLQKWVMRW